MASASGDFSTLLARGGEALDGVGALLTWRELRGVCGSCRAARASRLRALWVRRSRVQLPPTAAATDALLRGAFSNGAASVFRCLAIAHTACLTSPLARSSAWLAGVKQLDVVPSQFTLPHGLTTAPMDFAGLAAVLPSLQELSLAGMSDFVDATGLAQLGRLRRLDLSGTGVRDLDPLTSLHQLEYLDVSATNVTSLAPLQALERLLKIVLDVHRASCALASLATWLQPPALLIKSVRGTGDSMSLERDLLNVATSITEFASREFVSRWQLTDDGYARQSAILSALRNVELLALSGSLLFHRLDFLRGLDKLRVLHVSPLRSSDISALAALQALEEVLLTADKCVDLSPLASLPRLRSLYCHGGDPDSMTQVSRTDDKIQLRELTSLDVSNHYLQQLDCLDCLEELTVYVWSGDSLVLPRGCVQSLSKLHLNGDVALCEIFDRFPRLRLLELQQCASFDPQVLPLFTKLESLSLLDPSSHALLPQEPMPQLRILCLRGPNVNEVSGDMLKSVPNLEELDLEQTDVADISALITLRKLRVVNLKDTQVDDVTPLLLIPSLVTVILPKRAQCAPLVHAYHDESVVSDLREVLHPTKNCLWGPHWRQRPHEAGKTRRQGRSKTSPALASVGNSPVSNLGSSLERCSVT